MPWLFSSKAHDRPRLPELAPAGFCDLHSHALWGIDDGPADPAESHAILDGLAELGFRRAALTRHHNHPLFANATDDEAAARAAELRSARSDRPPELAVGAEIMVDERFLEELYGDRLPHTGAPGTYLIEFAYGQGTVPRGFEELVFRLQAKQITLVVAHAERYPDFQRDRDRLAAIARAGALVQVNLMSLSGRYGRKSARTGWQLIETGIADLVASDLHHAADLPEVRTGLEELARTDRDELLRLASTNPALLLDGRPFEVSRRE
jgi:tyrosine-protein phosphatase YwqE